MLFSITEFIEQNPEVSKLYGYQNFLQDLNKKKSSHDLNAIASRLLSNYYGHQADDDLCLAYRRYVQKKMEGIK
jgi:hypothetical protein